ncbi:hypothetical protein [Streptomyces sp. NPDC015130]|uniref:hypothetical protein n=1 Tax=Streptomyces sp. NPDC015130 TaxID=3364940 RepID=UPI0036FAFD90
MAEIWNEQQLVASDRHPGHGGVDPRYDELTALLAPHRKAPAHAKLLVAEWRYGGGARYRADGVDYWVRWCEPEPLMP